MGKSFIDDMLLSFSFQNCGEKFAPDATTAFIFYYFGNYLFINTTSQRRAQSHQKLHIISFYYS